MAADPRRPERNPRRWEARFWAGAVVAAAAAYVLTLPQTFFLFDAAKDWSQALVLNAAGQWADRGTNITGLGSNGPLLPWLYQSVLWLWPSEFALPAASAAMALAALAAGAALLARRADLTAAQRYRALALLATSPLLFEWTRIGVDVAFLAPLIPAVAWAWQRASVRQRAQDWLVVGIVVAIGTQVYVIFVAAAVGVALSAALMPPRVGEARSGRLLWLLLGAAAVLWPLGPDLRLQAAVPRLLPSPVEMIQASWTMLGAYPQHLAARAAAGGGRAATAVPAPRARRQALRRAVVDVCRWGGDGGLPRQRTLPPPGAYVCGAGCRAAAVGVSVDAIGTGDAVGDGVASVVSVRCSA